MKRKGAVLSSGTEVSQGSSEGLNEHLAEEASSSGLDHDGWAMELVKAASKAGNGSELLRAAKTAGEACSVLAKVQRKIKENHYAAVLKASEAALDKAFHGVRDRLNKSYSGVNFDSPAAGDIFLFNVLRTRNICQADGFIDLKDDVKADIFDPLVNAIGRLESLGIHKDTEGYCFESFKVGVLLSQLSLVVGRPDLLTLFSSDLVGLLESSEGKVKSGIARERQKKGIEEQYGEAIKFAVEIAEDRWREERENGESITRIGDVARDILRAMAADLKGVGLTRLPDIETVKGWIKSGVADYPREASRGGRGGRSSK